MTDPVKPFSEQGHYTVFHDALIDDLMPTLNPNEWKIVCFVVRKTRGWQKKRDTLSYKQIMEGTGIKSQTTLTKALNALIGNEDKPVEQRNGVLLRWRKRAAQPGQFAGVEYGLNPNFEIVPSSQNGEAPDPAPSTENGEAAAPKNEDGPTTENGDINNHTPSTTPNNHTLLSEGKPSTTGKTDKKGRLTLKGMTDEQAAEAIADINEALPADIVIEMEKLVSLAAEGNKSNEMKMTRAWREFWGILKSYYDSEDLSDDAWVYALREAVSRGKGTMRYVIAVAKDYKPTRGRAQGQRHLRVVSDNSGGLSDEEFDRKFGA